MEHSEARYVEYGERPHEGVVLYHIFEDGSCVFTGTKAPHQGSNTTVNEAESVVDNIVRQEGRWPTKFFDLQTWMCYSFRMNGMFDYDQLVFRRSAGRRTDYVSLVLAECPEEIYEVFLPWIGRLPTPDSNLLQEEVRIERQLLKDGIRLLQPEEARKQGFHRRERHFHRLEAMHEMYVDVHEVLVDYRQSPHLMGQHARTLLHHFPARFGVWSRLM